MCATTLTTAINNCTCVCVCVCMSVHVMRSLLQTCVYLCSTAIVCGVSSSVRTHAETAAKPPASLPAPQPQKPQTYMFAHVACAHTHTHIVWVVNNAYNVCMHGVSARLANNWRRTRCTLVARCSASVRRSRLFTSADEYSNALSAAPSVRSFVRFVAVY